MIPYYLNGFETLSTDVYEKYQDLGLIGSIDSIRLYADILNNNAQNTLDNCNSFENIQYCFELIKAFEKQYLLGSLRLFDIQLDASVGVGINDRFSRVYDRFQERSDLVNGAKYCIKNISSGEYLQINSGISNRVETDTLDEEGLAKVWTVEAVNMSFDQTLSHAPIVLSHTQTRNGGHPMVTRHRNISTSSLGIYLQEEEAQNDGHMFETIGIIWVIEP